MRTLKGYSETEVTKLMIKPLPGRAIKPHQSKSYLSQISPAYTRERLTKIFGLYGIGWGLDWDPLLTDRFETQTSTGKARYHFALMKADFWFRMTDDDGNNEIVIKIPVTGYSDNDNIGDAMSGARTSAISAGAKELLFQLHIYKNEPPPAPEVKKVEKEKGFDGDDDDGQSAGNVEQSEPAGMTKEKLLYNLNRVEKIRGFYQSPDQVAEALALEDWPAPDNVELWRSLFAEARGHALEIKEAEKVAEGRRRAAPWRPTEDEFFKKAAERFGLAVNDIADELKEKGFDDYDVDKAGAMWAALEAAQKEAQADEVPF